eukprot:Ihof_evm12s132 gene=Ihof_evmTU12s132
MEAFNVINKAEEDTPEAIAKATNILCTFNKKHEQTFSFSDKGYEIPVKIAFIEALLLRLTPNHSKTWDNCEFQEQGLLCLRILSRERQGLQALHTRESILLLMMYAGFQGTVSDCTTQLPIKSGLREAEAVKCLINAIYDNQPVATIFTNEGGPAALVQRINHLFDRDGALTGLGSFDLRLLFMITATHVQSSQQVVEARGVAMIVRVLEGIINPSTQWPLSEHSQTVAGELYKIAFNITNNWSRFSDCDYVVQDADKAIFGRLVVTIRYMLLGYANACLPMNAPLLTHAVNVLFNTPITVESYLISVNNRGKYDWAVVDAILKYMDQCAQDTEDSAKLRGQLCAILTALCSFCKNNRDLRRYMFSKILPKRVDFSRRPEQENSCRGHLVALMTSHLTYVKDVVADFLFVLCKENITRLIKHTGYGNAAGLLAQRGFLGLPNDKSNVTGYSSDDSDLSDLDEANQIDPVTG